jgi:ERCC4-related helicase
MKITTPVIGAKVSCKGQKAIVVDRSPSDPNTVSIRFKSGDTSWVQVHGLLPSYTPGDHVKHAGNKALKGLGTGMVLATREVIGFHQVLVQFFETGLSRWMDWRLLSQANSAEIRIMHRHPGHLNAPAERVRMRTLAKALSIWDANTGALGRLDIHPLPHQLDVARKVVTSPQARWLIADDVGLGKTIEVGLILHALTKRNRCHRTLIVCPSSLTKQWKEEMRLKFNRNFEIYNIDFKPEFFSELQSRENVIISLDLAKRPEHKEMLLGGGVFDVIVFDEAHRLGVSENGTRTERYMLAEALNTLCHAFLLLTATPHQGKTERFRALLQLVRPDLAMDLAQIGADSSVVREVVIRNRKSMVTDAQGKLIFQGHDTLRHSITPSSQMAAVDAELQNYLREGYRSSAQMEDKALGAAVGFVMATYRKLASSSLAAIDLALHRRLTRLADMEQQMTQSAPGRIPLQEDLEENAENLTDIELPRLGAFFSNEAERVQNILKLIAAAKPHDTKLQTFLTTIADHVISKGDNLLVFTEYRATQDYLISSLQNRFPDIGCARINGGMSIDEKVDVVKNFNDGKVRVLVSTEAGGEGLNLQKSCHIMVNYDLPWNPSRLVQRIGRLYRYGQDKRVQVINLHNDDGFDNSALALMLDRVTTIADQLAAVRDQPPEVLASEILGDLVANIDMEAILERATTMTPEQTEKEIENAIALAKESLKYEEDILSFAASSGTRVSGGFDSRHMAALLTGMAPFVGFTVEKVSKDQKTFDIELEEEHVGRWPEFRRRRHVRLSLDHNLAERDPDVVLMDLESAFMRHLVDHAQNRDDFDGVYGETGAVEGWGHSDILTTHQVRWQSLSGDILEEDLIPVRMVGQSAQEMPRGAFAELLLTPFVSVKATGGKEARASDIVQSFGEILAKHADGERMPGSAMTFSALRFQ